MKQKASVNESFDEWLRLDSPELSWDARHLAFLYKALERVTSGDCRRLMIFMPPRHGKSETVSVRYSAWRIARDPKLNIILGSYNQKLANRFSRRVRRIVERLMPLASDRRAADEWETREGGGLRAVGVGAGITGFGAKLVIIDDPVKSRAHAESTNRRNAAWDWFCDDIYTRLEPKAAIIVIQTRWHEDDLSGRLLREMAAGAEQWEVVDLPAFARKGDALGRRPGSALWPKRFPVRELRRIRERLGSYSFEALYQQRPVPRSGGLFKREWFSRVVSEAPRGLSWARGYDLAVSTRTSADRTASFRCAFGKDGTLYIADGFCGRIAYPDQRRYVIDRLLDERNTVHGIEKALHGQALVQDLLEDTRTRGRPLTAVRVDADKWTRAHSWSALAESGKVALVRGRWIEDFLDEVCAFPHGSHDDQVDAVSIAVGLLRAKRPRTVHTFD